MNYKGQGALEYLMILGAVILVVAIVLIAITGTMNQGLEQGNTSNANYSSAYNTLREKNNILINNTYYSKTGSLVSNLRAVWHFDDLNADNFTPDSSGNGNDLKCTPRATNPNGEDCPGKASGKFGGALSFVKGSKNVISGIVSPNSLERTITFWIKPGFDFVGTDGANYGVFKVTPLGNVANLSQGSFIIRNIQQDIVFYICTWAAPTYLCGADSGLPLNTSLNQNNWYFFALVSSKKISASNPKGFIGTYLNGTLLTRGNNPYENTGADSNIQAPVKFDFGTSIISGPAESGVPPYFNGSIDEVAIWDRALSEAEILELYNKALSSS